WAVTAVEPGRSFSWSTSRPGVTTVGTHAITVDGSGSEIRLQVDQHGVLAPLVHLLVGRRTRKYMEQEARGLKQRTEARRTAAADVRTVKRGRVLGAAASNPTTSAGARPWPGVARGAAPYARAAGRRHAAACDRARRRSSRSA